MAKSLTIAAYDAGFQFAEAIIWACAGLRKLSCNCRQQEPQQQEAGEFFSVHWSSTALFTSVCARYGMGRHNKDLLSANLNCTHVVCICWLCIILPQCACAVWRSAVICLIPDDTIDTRRPRPWFLGVTRPRPCELPFLADRKRAFPSPLRLHSRALDSFNLDFWLETSSNSPQRVVSVASSHNAYPPPLNRSLPTKSSKGIRYGEFVQQTTVRTLAKWAVVNVYTSSTVCQGCVPGCLVTLTMEALIFCHMQPPQA